VVAVASTAAAIYFLVPSLIRRREGVAKESPHLPGALISWVDEQIEAADLQHRVRVHWRLADPRPRARVFGRPGAYQLLMAGGMLGLFLNEPARARAIVSHELAHIKHGDVDVVYAALSLWWAFLVISLAPAVLAWVIRPAPELLDSIIGAVPLVLILFGARNLVLHDAEHRADLEGGAMHDAAPTSTPPRFVADWLRAHPTHEARRAVMESPMLYLRVRPIDFVLFASVAGLAVGISGGLLPLSPGQRAGILFGGAEEVSFDVTKRLPQIFLLLAVSSALAYLLIRSRASNRVASVRPIDSRSMAAWWMLGLVIASPPRFGQPSLPEAMEKAKSHPPLQSYLDLLADPLISGAVAFAGAFATGMLLLALWLAWLGRVADAWLPVLLSRSHIRRWLIVAVIGFGAAIAPVLMSVTAGMQMLVFLPTIGAALATQVGTAPALVPSLLQFALFVGNPLHSIWLLAIGLLPLIAARAMPQPVGQILHASGPLLAQGQEVVVDDPRRRLRSLFYALLLVMAGAAVMMLAGDAALSAVDSTNSSELVGYLGAWLGLWAAIAAIWAGAGRQPWRWSTAAIPAALAGIIGTLWVLPTSIVAGVPGLALIAGSATTVAALIIATPILIVFAVFQRCKLSTLTIVGGAMRDFGPT
jgi:hypothetical protein